MIHYVALPLELVFEGSEMYRPDLVETTVGGVTMLIERTSPVEGRIVRLISPNPQDYLNPQFAPGTAVRFVPQWG